MLVFAVTIFTGAFLLFQVQPLIAKYILPWFGGGPGVWTTCLLFFQVLLLGGYAYAHFSSRWLKPRVQAIGHLVLLAAALALLPITPSDSWKPTGSDHPTLQILALLAASLGLPYFVLSSTGPLMQQWFSLSTPGRSPYRLYALSNVGSLLALVSYPFFFETHFTRKTQAWLWGDALLVFGLFCAGCALALWKSEIRSRRSEEEPKADRQASALASLTLDTGHSTDPPRPSRLNYLLWLLLPACASVLLLATTNKLCQDVAVMPFLWVLPLSLYLLSFIICFDSPRWYEGLPFRPALLAALGAVWWVLPKGNETSLLVLLGVYCGALFICCMVCHGELYRLKPEPQHLTSFYLVIAAGGALGGVLVALVAPHVFSDYYELQWGLVLCGGLLLVACARDRQPAGLKQTRWLAWVLPLAVLAGLDRLLSGLVKQPSDLFDGCLLGARIGGGIFLVFLAYLGLEGRALDRPGARIARASEPRSAAAPAAGCGGLSPPERTPGETPGRPAGQDARATCAARSKGATRERRSGWSLLVLLFMPWAARQHFKDYQHWRRLACSWLAIGLVVFAVGLWGQAHRFAHLLVHRSRDFYGVLSILEDAKEDPDYHCLELMHGQTLHGLQFFHPMGATWPTLYYTDNSGVGLALGALPKGARRIGLVGLGIGTLAAYARTNDYFCFYEINPEVQRLAASRFSYLAHCRGKVAFKLGDARLSLEHEPPQHFDLLALDAFSSDAIPVHLLTREAFELYARHLKTNGVIAVHISNKYLDLEPVLLNVAREFNYGLAVIDTHPAGPDKWWNMSATWALLTHNREILDTPAIRQASRPPHQGSKKLRLWTDDFTSLFQVLQ